MQGNIDNAIVIRLLGRAVQIRGFIVVADQLIGEYGQATTNATTFTINDINPLLNGLGRRIA